MKSLPQISRAALTGMIYFLFKNAYTMAADVLATQVARALAAIVFPME